MNLRKNNKGFTIVEVVLVLAIAGLIFLIVFLALPQLQRSRRDTQRRADMGRAAAALEQYAANSNGAYPAANAGGFGGFIPTYLTNSGSTWSDPSSGVTYAPIYTGTPATGQVLYNLGSVCNAVGVPTTAGATARNVALAVLLETGGQYCQDNQ